MLSEMSSFCLFYCVLSNDDEDVLLESIGHQAMMMLSELRRMDFAHVLSQQVYAYAWCELN